MLQKIKDLLITIFKRKEKPYSYDYHFRCNENDQLLGRLGASLLILKTMADIRKENTEQPQEFDKAYNGVCQTINDLSILSKEFNYKKNYKGE